MLAGYLLMVRPWANMGDVEVSHTLLLPPEHSDFLHFIQGCVCAFVPYTWCHIFERVIDLNVRFSFGDFITALLFFVWLCY